MPRPPIDLVGWEEFCREVVPLGWQESGRRKKPLPTTRTAPRAVSAEQLHNAVEEFFALLHASGEDIQPLNVQHSALRAPTEVKPTQNAIVRAPRMANPLPAPPPQSSPTFHLDATLLRRLARGTRAPDAVLDLHGHTVPQAHEAVRGAIPRAQRAQKSLLLIITGKGSSGDGKLRQALPIWLAEPDLAPAIIGFGPAHARHGGSGAFYVRLRKGAV